MKILYRHILRSFLRRWLALFLVGVPAAFLCAKVGYTYVPFLFGFLFLLLGFFGAFQLDAFSYQLQGHPVRKTKLLLFAACVNHSAGLLGAGGFLLYEVAALLIYGWHTDAWAEWRARAPQVPRIAHELGSQIVQEIFFRPAAFGGFLLFLSVLVFFSFAGGGRLIRLNQQTLLGKIDWSKREEWPRGLRRVAAGAAAFTLAYVSGTAFVAILIAAIWVATAKQVGDGWGFPSRQRKQIFMIAYGTAAALGLLCFAHSFWLTHSPRPERRLAAIESLGYFGPALDRDLLEGLLRRPIPESAAAMIAARAQAGEISSWPGFLETLAAQKDPAVIKQLAHAYPARALTEEDLLLLLEKERQGSSAKGWDSIPQEAHWVNAPLSEDLVALLLRRETRAPAKLALRHIQYHPEEKWIAPVKAALRSSLPADLLPEGVLTLSLLLGKRLNLRSYLAELNANSKFFVADCRGQNLDNLGKLREGIDEATYNRCLRKLIAYREPLPWKEVPRPASR